MGASGWIEEPCKTIGHSSRVATVAAGATSHAAQPAGESARFRAGNWALITGMDIQGYGYPPNPAFFEYVQITAINSHNGINHLRRAYKKRLQVDMATLLERKCV